MSYTAALNLAEVARKYSLLDGNDFLKTMLRVIALDDDPELEADIAGYIGIKALNRTFSGYRL